MLNLVTRNGIRGMNDYRYDRRQSREPLRDVYSITGINESAKIGFDHLEIVVQRNESDIIDPRRGQRGNHLLRRDEEFRDDSRKHVGYDG